MSLSFINPLLLWLLLLLPALWLFAYATRGVNLARLGRGRFLALVGLRSLIVLALVLALAGAQLVRAVDDTAVVFLIDGSDSLAPALREQALDYVNESIAAGQERDQIAVVVFGADAAVERAPGPLAPLSRLGSVVVGSRTDIADAIQLGLALLPADAQKRMVLLSDGGENEGRAIEAARLAAARGVPISVVPLRGERGADVLLSELTVPAGAREGQELPLTIAAESSVAGPARIEVFADGQLVAAEDVDLPIGRSTFTVNVPAGDAGFRRLEARVSAPADTQPLNNRAAAFAQVQGPPHVLLVSADEGRAAAFRAALEAAGLRATLIGPRQIPAGPADLQQYAAIALIDTLAAEVPTPTQNALVNYVESQGGSLLMVGGAQSFGAGGWRRTPIAAILPVDLDPPSTEQRPDLALALVIDRSGSMSEPVAGLVGQNKLGLAKEAVYQATLGLARNDRLGLTVFDDTARELLPMQPLPDLAAIEATLSQISAGGGTDIRAGIVVAVEQIAAVDARIRHVILLTDGQADSNYGDLIDQMRESSVTISIVSIGADANPNLRAIAERGGGAFYQVNTPADVPRIFLEETIRVARRDIVEQPFTPAVALNAPPVRDLGGLPALLGYNNSAPRAAARTILIAPDGAPILAVWQRGLGRTLAWTSDLKAQWAGDWLSWGQFPRFAAGLIDVVLPPPSADQLSLELRSDGPLALIDLALSDPGGPAPAAIAGRLLDPQGNGVDLTFTQVALGRYRAVAPADQPGVYLAQMVALAADGQPVGAASGGLVVSYSPEYGASSANPGLLEELTRLTGGAVAPPAADLFTSAGQRVGQIREIALPLLWMALALLPLDIALRRLLLRRQDLPAFLPARPARPQPAPAPASTIDRLRAVRSREARTGASRGALTGGPVGEGELSSSPPSPAGRAAGDEGKPTDEERMAALLAAKRRRGK